MNMYHLFNYMYMLCTLYNIVNIHVHVHVYTCTCVIAVSIVLYYINTITCLCYDRAWYQVVYVYVGGLYSDSRSILL